MATAKKSAGVKLLKKLTIRTFIGSKMDILAYALQGREGKEPEGSPVPLMSVMGYVTGFSTGESDFGTYTKLRGQFEATNLQTGEVNSDCSTAILPGVVADSVAAALQAGAQSVAFWIEIDARFSEKAATMYEFEARAMKKPETPDVLKQFKAQMLENGITGTEPLKLAAPKLTEAQIKAQAKAEEAADEARAAAAKKATAKA